MNGAPPPVAPVDPVPLPAPVGVLYFFLILSFALHIVPMNCMLGGGFWVMVARGPLRQRLRRWLPVWTAAAITTGVAALLFLQVLYGQLFYSATVAIAWPWLSVIGLLLVGYYAYYISAYRAKRQPRFANLANLVGFAAFALIALIYVTQMTLMIDPKATAATYFSNPRGLNWNFNEPTLWPRYLHMILGAIAVTTLWIAGLGAVSIRRGDDDVGRATVGFAARGLLWTTVLQLGVGVWFLLALPHERALLFVGHNLFGTTCLGLAIVLVTVAVWLLWGARRSPTPGRRVIVAAAHLFGVLLAMIGVRDTLRREATTGVINFNTMAVSSQWAVVTLFVGLLLAGLATVGWMLVRLRRHTANQH